MSTKAREPGTDDVLEQVHGLMHLVRARQFRALRESGQELTHMESRVLGFFGRNPGGTLSELVAHSGRDKGQLARLVAGLRERGLLEARVDEADRRNQRLHLTGAGSEAHQALRRQARKLSTVAVKGLSDAEKAQLQSLLARLRANLDEEQP
ncbi:winged helix-turn-helix transcriptional regulator [Ramlibacter sp. USB13]|uniref:Winged helix-turn-helix transcriptional regulator n=1 Tax=Ramlibacter cellulosilyticus TaxID=2764187 RepID=A0A923SBF6_9BURK|nr:MarR family winged helix-turn-helix transcriptional regulator [Ramlibacter cellulosilyticus]MBC5783820.1 winged helix-turn-helix transcriptional regulator [Ramlibacter cellulosilyticus]